MNIKITPDLAYLFGVYLGDGYAGKHDFVLQTANYGFALNFRNTLFRVFNRKQKILKYKLWVVSFGSNDFAKFLRDFFENKNIIPEELLNAKNEIKANFLRGFFDSEGYISLHKIRLTQKINTKYFKQIRKMCESLGIKCNKIYQYEKYENNCLACKHCKHKKCPCVYEIFSITGYNDIKKFSETIGFGIPSFQENLVEMLLSYKQKSYSNEIYKEVMKLKEKKKISELSKEFNIPYKTVWQWIMNKRIPPDVMKCQN
jgi:intein/homing endonuclease